MWWAGPFKGGGSLEWRNLYFIFKMCFADAIAMNLNLNLNLKNLNLI